MIKKQIQKIALSTLLKRAKSEQRTVQFHNISSCKSVGILWKYDVTSKNTEFEKLKQLFTKQGSKVKCLGYLDTSVHKETLAAVINSELLSEKDCNWSGKAKLPEIESFQETKFDLLLDMTVEECLPIQRIVVDSNAEFKVGMNKQNNFYDFTVDLGKEKSVQRFATEVVNYLEKFKY